MKRIMLLILCALYLCINPAYCKSLLSIADSGFINLISQVPITKTPIGEMDLDNISKIKIDLGAPNKIDTKLLSDNENKYGLNNAFMFDDLNLINYAKFMNHTLLTQSAKMKFVMRLPPINNHEFLIYSVMRTNDGQLEYPLYVLLMVDSDTTVLSSAVIAGVDVKENDQITRFVFGIDSDYVLSVKMLSSSYDYENDDPNYLYDLQTVKYRVSIDGIIEE